MDEDKKQHNSLEEKENKEQYPPIEAGCLMTIIILILMGFFIVILVLAMHHSKNNHSLCSKNTNKHIQETNVNIAQNICKRERSSLENTMLNLGGGGNKFNIQYFSRLSQTYNKLAYCTMVYYNYGGNCHSTWYGERCPSIYYYIDYITNGNNMIKIFKTGVDRHENFMHWYKYYHYNN